MSLKRMRKKERKKKLRKKKNKKNLRIEIYVDTISEKKIKKSK